MNSVDLAVQQPENLDSSTSTWKDWLGIVASIGCAIHCAAMPFVFAYLPALGLSFLADEAFHKWMALVCFLIAIVAFIPGIRKHKSWLPISVGAFGLALITFAAFGLAGQCCSSCAASTSAVAAPASTADAAPGCDQCENCQSCNAGEINSSTASSTPEEQKNLLSTLTPWITPVGGIFLVCAHLLNRRYGCLCGCC